MRLRLQIYGYLRYLKNYWKLWRLPAKCLAAIIKFLSSRSADFPSHIIDSYATGIEGSSAQFCGLRASAAAGRRPHTSRKNFRTIRSIPLPAGRSAPFPTASVTRSSCPAHCLKITQRRNAGRLQKVPHRRGEAHRPSCESRLHNIDRLGFVRSTPRKSALVHRSGLFLTVPLLAG